MDKMDNIAEQLRDDDLRQIGIRVCTDYDDDLMSRTDWDERRGRWTKLFGLFREKKTSPWENCANVSIPTLSIAVVQFQARASEAFFSSPEIVHAKYRDPIVKDKSLRVGRFMNYQLTEQMFDWQEDMDNMLMELPLMGSCFKKTYYDNLLKRPVSRYINTGDFVIPYGVRTLEDAPRKTHVLRMQVPEIRKRVVIGEYVPIKEYVKAGSTPSSSSHQPAPEIEQARDKILGITENSFDDDKPRIVLEQHRDFDFDGDGLVEPYIITVDYESKKVLRIESRIMKNVLGHEFVMDYFTAYTFLPNPQSVYGFGFGHLLEGCNEAINSLINQIIDAGTLANNTSGFYNRRSGLRAGDFSFKMGQFKPVDLSTDDLSKAIYPFRFNPPSQVLFTLLTTLQNYASQMSSVSDTLMGQMPPSDTAATTVLAVLEQGLKVFSTIQKRLHRALKSELKKLFIVNSLTVDNKEYVTTQNMTAPEFLTIPKDAKMDFLSGIDVVPVSDPNVASKAERVIRAQQAYEMGKNDPLIVNNPDAMFLLASEVYRALEIEGISKILKKPEPQIPQDIPPQEENAGFLKEIAAVVLPEQNHVEHLSQHRDFKDSPIWYAELTPQGKNLLEKHIMDTNAALYLMVQEANDESRRIRTGMGGMDTLSTGQGFQGNIGETVA